MALLAGASAATLAAPAHALIGAASAAKAPAARRPAAALPPSMRAEIEKQQALVADALKVIRGYPLPPGSPMAFEFRALRSKRRS